jgi:hypothetical protein
MLSPRRLEVFQRRSASGSASGGDWRAGMLSRWSASAAIVEAGELERFSGNRGCWRAGVLAGGDCGGWSALAAIMVAGELERCGGETDPCPPPPETTTVSRRRRAVPRDHPTDLGTARQRRRRQKNRLDTQHSAPPSSSSLARWSTRVNVDLVAAPAAPPRFYK